MKRLRAWFLAPSWTVTIVLFIAPMAIVLAYSLLTRGVYGGITPPWTIESWTRLADSLYLTILLRSFWIAGASTLLCLVCAFPLALFLARAGKRKNLYLSLVILPFWTSFLVRTYAWMFLLRDTGVINTALQKLGLIHDPLPLLYNDGAVILGLVYGYLPFMVLPLYATLEEAALDLGANEWQAFRYATLPTILPGVIAAALLAFTVSFDDYVITSLVAGVDSETLPMVIYAIARRGVNPVVNAISALIVFGLGALILISERARKA
jgi:spermidine/putrescine transport system permease protein